MSGRRIMSIIGLSMVVLLIVCLFLPISSSGSYNYWDYLGDYRLHLEVLVLIELIVAALLLILQICGVLKDTKIAMIPVGMLFTFNLGLFFNAVEYGFDAFGFGYYLSLVLTILTVIVLGIGGLLSNDKKKRYIEYAQPVGYDPQTGKPIYDTPKQIVGYDPQTGQPIYK